MNNAAIGFFDSGVGGLTVVSEVMRQLPNEKIIYIGDTARSPYGIRKKEEVLEFSLELADFLKKKQVKILVIACNTATSMTLEEIKKKLDIPVIGVISPGVRSAIKATKNKKVGVIGTLGTIESCAYQKSIAKKAPDVEVFSLSCPEFVSVVESNQFSEELAKKNVFETLQPLSLSKVDTLVLGCTHYPLLKPIISAVMGKKVSLIDSGKETISDLSFLLEYFNLQAENKKTNLVHEFYTTGSAKMFEKIAKNLLNFNEIKATHIEITALTMLEEEKEIVIATHNLGKAKEFSAMFEEKGYLVKTLKDYPEIPKIPETGLTFEENARAKAQTVANLLDRPVLADDSGLMVDELGGFPGAFSARFAGDGASDAANNAKLLHELASLTALPERRGAKFHCTLVFAAPEKKSLVVEADWEGSVATVPQGDNGFGYDPLFLIDGLNKTAAELTLAEKNQISHRAKALQKLHGVWEEWLKNDEKENIGSQ